MNNRYLTASELVSSVETLLTLPDIYILVKEIVEDPDSCLSDLVNSISVDPGISARLLRLVNSAYFNLGSPVDNIRQAVNLLGMRPVHDLVLATTLTTAFSQSRNEALDMKKFWELSVTRAVYSSLIASRCDELEPETLFINGLLCDIGHQIMFMQIPVQATEAINKSSATHTPIHVVEQELLGYNYAEVGAELMHNWGMPESIVEVVRQHIHPQDIHDFARESAIVHIANVLSQLNEIELNEALLVSTISPEAWHITGLTTQDLILIHTRASIEIEQTIGALLGHAIAA